MTAHLIYQWSSAHYFLAFILAILLILFVEGQLANFFRLFNRPKCDVCGKPSRKLCDGSGGECKARICYSCNCPSGKLDLCPRHARQA